MICKQKSSQTNFCKTEKFCFLWDVHIFSRKKFENYINIFLQAASLMQLKTKQFVANTSVENVKEKLAIFITHMLFHSMYGKEGRKGLNPGKIFGKPQVKDSKNCFVTQIQIISSISKESSFFFSYGFS